MTKFDKITQNPQTLAAFIFGLIDQTETNILEYIECTTGITITRVQLAPEIRIASIAKDLTEEEDDVR